MFYRKKKGQITIFVILAVVVLFAFIFLMYAKSQVDQGKLSVLAKQQMQDYVTQNSLNLYVTSCIDAVTDEALILASLQGGVFNFSNMTYGKDYITYYVPEYNRTVNVSLAITMNDKCSVVMNNAPDYPYHNSQVIPANFLTSIYDLHECKYSGDLYTYYSGFFGYNRLARLCNWNGTNKVLATSTAYGFRTCELGTYNDKFVTSIQEELENFIGNEMRKCVNFTEVLKRIPANITVSGDPKTYLTFGQNGFNIMVQYPFLVALRGGQPIRTFYDFSSDRNIRFKELYDYSYFSARTDSLEAGFKMLEDKQGNSDLAQTYFSYDIKRVKSFDLNHTDIVRFIDNSTLINGNPMIFQFAIQNRRPALDKIRQYNGMLDLDILVAENQTIVIEPQGYDPDDDDIEYNYLFWKEDYDEYFNFSDNRCKNASSFEYVKQNCSVRISSTPHNFTKSTLFLSTNKSAEYTPRRNDTGYHELKVYIQEKNRQGLDDYQIVKILVFDKPKANITGNNLYNLSNNIASIEDPYILNGSNSVVGLSANLVNNTFSLFVWNSSEFNKTVIIMTERNKSLFIPSDINGSYTIMNITSRVFSNVGLTDIMLTVNTALGFSDTTNYSVDVKQCIPFRNLGIFPYPYNTTDPFFADHTCCKNDFTYAGNGSICFDNTIYGKDNTFFNFWSMVPYPSHSLGPAGPTYQAPFASTPYEGENDIFRRIFIRYCSGDRGNICVGDGLEKRQNFQFCDDTNNNAPLEFRKERCVGPPATLSGTTTIWTNSSTPLNCVNYPAGQSFEKFSGTGTGVCTTSPQCANPDLPNPFVSSDKRYTCSGQCSGGGCTVTTGCKCDSTCGSSGSSLCDHLASPGTGETITISCLFGSNNFQDSCDNCRLIDKVVSGKNICKSSGAGCNAATQCNDKNPSAAVTGNNYQYCNNTCQVESCLDNFAYSGTSCYTACSLDNNCAQGYKCCKSDMFYAGLCNGATISKCFSP